ncbi:MAG: hypothetical protein KAX49_20495, partial [Halanaerobiales bacterium]|nr:hypothetical protein [Halanaerobiales bacterium]
MIIERKYDNLAAVWESLAVQDEDIEGKEKVYHTFGKGWSLTIPRIETDDNGQFIYFDDGSAAKLEWEMDGQGLDKAGHGSIEYHKGHHFVGEKVQRKVRDVLSDSAKVGEEWEDTQITIIRKDGKTYNFDGSGKILSIIDQTGNNKIEFNYD